VNFVKIFFIMSRLFDASCTPTIGFDHSTTALGEISWMVLLLLIKCLLVCFLYVFDNKDRQAGTILSRAKHLQLERSR
jgi:hypothetical protein